MGFLCFFLVPFLGGNHLALPYVTIDMFWIETSFILLLIGSIIQTFFRKKCTGNFPVFLAWFAPFLLLSALSLIYTWNMYATIKEINVLIWAISAAYLYAISDQKTKLLDGLVSGSAVSVICAVLQLKILFPQLTAAFTEGRYAMMVLEKSVPFSAFVNENMFGGFFLFVLPIALYQAYMKKRLVHVTACLIIIAGILMSLSRLSVIIMILELGAMSVLLFRTAHRKQVLVLGATCVCAFLLFLSVGYSSGKERERGMGYWITHKASTAMEQAKTLNLRTEIWKGGIRAFFDRPVFGYGPGVFEYAYRRYFGGGLYTKYAHGGIIKIAVELGLAGLVAFGAYLIAVGLAIRRNTADGAFVLATVCGFLFIVVDYALDIPAFVVMFFVVSSTVFKAKHDSLLPRIPKTIFCFVILSLICSFAFTSRAELAKKAVEDGVLCEENGLFDEACCSYMEAARLMPLGNEPTTRIVGLIARRMDIEKEATDRERLGNIMDYYLKRIMEKRDRDAEMLFVSALAYRSRGDMAKAQEFVSKALALYPSSAYYASESADWYVRSGDFDRAQRVIDGLEPYVENIRNSGNPGGLYVYRLRDLQAEIAHRKGDEKLALAIAEKNLASANSEEFMITAAKARQLVRKEWLLHYLAERVAFYKGELKKEEGLQG